MDRFLRKPFWFFLRTLFISGLIRLRRSVLWMLAAMTIRVVSKFIFPLWKKVCIFSPISVFRVCMTLHNWSLSSNCLVYQTSLVILSRPDTFLLSFFSELYQVHLPISVQILFFRLSWIIFHLFYFWIVSKQIVEMFFLLLKTFFLTDNL